MDDVMIDLETLGSDSSSVILTLGAVEFNRTTGETGREFFCGFDIQSQLDKGAKVSGSTIAFWLKQPDEARNTVLNVSTYPVDESLAYFDGWLNNDNKNGRSQKRLWGNSARFDIGILQDACIMSKKPIFWNFRLERCYRTKLAEFPEVAQFIGPVGTLHTSIGDCKTQIARLVYGLNAPIILTH